MFLPLSPRLKITARQISIFLLLSLSLSWLPLAGAKASPTQEQNKQEPKNDKARKVNAEPPQQGPPAANLPNLDEVKQRRDPEPEAPAAVPSTMRSRRKPVPSRGGPGVETLPPMRRLSRHRSVKGQDRTDIASGAGLKKAELGRSHHARRGPSANISVMPLPQGGGGQSVVWTNVVGVSASGNSS